METPTPALERRRSLDGELQKLHVVRRCDSALASAFISGALNCDDPAAIARELKATDFIFTNSLYGELSDGFHKAVANKIKKQYRITWTSVWTITKFYARVALKLIMVINCGLRIPERLAPPSSDDAMEEEK